MDRCTRLRLAAIVVIAAMGLTAGPARADDAAATDASSPKIAAAPSPATSSSSTAPPSRQVEVRLRTVHQLMSAGRFREAQRQAEALVAEAPNFQLGHLLLADALSAQAGRFGPEAIASTGAAASTGLKMSTTLGDSVAALRQEARRRVAAVQDRPPAGHLPSAFLALPESVRHAIAVDTSRHRLYLFERSGNGLRLVADHYVSIGKAGTDKRVEGDQRTPVGVYYTTSRLEGHQLADLYGSGALSLNYPNDVDKLKGRTGSGIWLHGTPAAQYARAPLSSDGCVVLSNPDMARLLQTVAPQGTPVVIAHRLDWIEPHVAARSSRGLGDAIAQWWAARDEADEERLAAHYGSTATRVAVGPQLRRVSTREPEMPARFQPPKELSILTWHDQIDHAVVTFGDVGKGQRTGVIRRQYWAHDGQRWRIVHESINPN